MDQQVVAARCALHPERLAEGTCKRCGTFTCAECNVATFDSGALCKECADRVPHGRYHVVPVWRFVLFTFLTFNFYPIWWFWKSWKLVKQSDGSDIWPLPRAIFAGFTYFSLITDMNTQLSLRGNSRRLSHMLGVGLLVSNGVSRLPEPYSMLALLGGLFVLPALIAARELAGSRALAEGGKWRLRHTLLTLVAVPFALLAAIGLLLPEEQ